MIVAMQTQFDDKMAGENYNIFLSATLNVVDVDSDSTSIFLIVYRCFIKNR